MGHRKPRILPMSTPAHYYLYSCTSLTTPPVVTTRYHYYSETGLLCLIWLLFPLTHTSCPIKGNQTQLLFEGSLIWPLFLRTVP